MERPGVAESSYPKYEIFVDQARHNSWRVGKLRNGTFDGTGLILTRYPKEGERTPEGVLKGPYESWMPTDIGVPSISAIENLVAEMGYESDDESDDDDADVGPPTGTAAATVEKKNFAKGGRKKKKKRTYPNSENFADNAERYSWRMGKLKHFSNKTNSKIANWVGLILTRYPEVGKEFDPKTGNRILPHETWMPVGQSGPIVRAFKDLFSEDLLMEAAIAAADDATMEERSDDD